MNSTLSRTNSNSTREFTSNSLRIIQSKQNQKILSKINNFTPTDCEFKDINEINDESFDIDKEIVQNTSAMLDNSLVKNIETMESIFQLKTTERDLLDKENERSIVKEIKEEKEKKEKEKRNMTNTTEIINQPKFNYKKMIVVVLIITIVIFSFLSGFGLKYLLK